MYPEVEGLRPTGVEGLQHQIGRKVVVAGVVVAARRIKTSTGKAMAFASICSRDGIAEVTMFEDTAMEYADLIQLNRLVAVHGVVTEDLERGVGIEVSRVRTIHSRSELHSS